MRFMHSLIKSLTFEWISYGMDSEPSFWRLWAPVALKKMRFFSCMNISNQISKTWMFGLFRPYVLYPMSETLEILKIGYSRWSFADPAPGYITANNHFNRKRKSLPNDPDSLGKRRRYSDLPGDSTENVLPLLSLLKPLSEGEAEDYQLAGIDLVAKLESLTEGRDNEYVLSRSSRPAFPQLLQLELKLWHEIACINNFAPFFDVENRSFKRLQRLHLEGYNLPRHFVWGDLGRSAEAEEFPSQYGLLRDIQKDGIDGDSVGTRYPENRGSSSQTQQIKVTHDNLWEDNLAVLPGRNPQKWSQRHVIPWGSCWSWAVDPEKAYRYFDTLEARLPWVSVLTSDHVNQKSVNLMFR